MIKRRYSGFLAVSVAIISTFSSSLAFAASINFTGNFRTEADLFSHLDLGVGNIPSSKAFLSARALLEPKLIIDDHFTLNSQWSLLTSPGLTPSGSSYGPMGAGQGGYIFGDTNTAGLYLNRVWLEWTSDFGVVRVGRMPISWGYGLIWDSGNEIWDDFQTTYDRLEYQLHFGHLIGAIAYSKPRKLSTLGNTNDQDFYTVYIRYDNPEQDVEAGVLFQREIRSSSQNNDLKTVANPLYMPPVSGYTMPPLSQNAPYALANNVVDIYFKKTMDYFTFGAEIGWLQGTATDFASMNAFGGMLNVTYENHKVKAFLDFLYASGDANLGQGHMNGFVELNRNRRPGLILGQELLGNYANGGAQMGSPLYYGYGSNVFSGVYYLRPGFRFEWSETWASGVEVIFAQKAAVASGDPTNLGLEVDLGTDHSFYKNFDMGITFGYLFPGSGLLGPGAGSPTGVFAVRTTGAVKF